MTVLNTEQRIEEIARIMGGDDRSELMLQTARAALIAANPE